jgi:NAD(P)-dependent dehydrogenase (short-subunit alcohol dehydrogenase family)
MRTQGATRLLLSEEAARRAARHGGGTPNLQELAMTSTEPLHVVTGAGGAIGFECARRIGHRGPLLLVDRDPERLAAATARLTLDGFVVERQAARDLSRPGEALALAGMLGDRPLGALVHAAGVGASAAGGRTVFDGNLLTADALLRAFLPSAREGSVAVCVTSVAAQTPVGERVARLLDDLDHPALFDALLSATDGEVVHPHVAYALAQRGIVRLCRRASALWGEAGARVVSVSAGLLDTADTRARLNDDARLRAVADGAPLRRLGSPREVAATVDWLVSPQASYVTGTDVVVDGGATAAAEEAALSGRAAA